MANYQDFINSAVKEAEKKLSKGSMFVSAGYNSNRKPIVIGLGFLTISPADEEAFNLPSDLYKDKANGLSSVIMDEVFPLLLGSFKFDRVVNTSVPVVRQLRSGGHPHEEALRRNFSNFEKKLYCGGYNHLFNFHKPNLVIAVALGIALFFDESHTDTKDVFDEEQKLILQTPVAIGDNIEALYGYCSLNDPHLPGRILNEGKDLDFDFCANFNKA